jgi:fructoselysine 6-phosphate deglycase
MSGVETSMKPVHEDFVETLENSLAQRERANEITAALVDRGVDNLYFVGCGGSLLATYPMQYAFDTRSSRVPAFSFTSNEFNFRRPRQLGDRSVVVVASHTGGTRETVQAIDTAREAGATVLGVTRTASSALAGGVDHAFTYESENTVWEAKQILLANIGWGLLGALGDAEERSAIDAAYDGLPQATLAAHEEQDQRSHLIAEKLKDEPIIYVLGAGPVEGLARCFSMCYLQEMQWMHSGAFNSGEFFHGAFEVVVDDVPVIVFAGEDETRPMALRAVDFLTKYTSKLHVADSEELSLPGVEASARGEVAPIVLGSIVSRMAKHFENVRGHDLSQRRYMTKVDY